jgi:hypothetical protein
MTRSLWLSRGAFFGLTLSSVLMAGCNTHYTVAQEGDALYDFEAPGREPVRMTDPDFSGPTVRDGQVPHVVIQTATLKPGKVRPEGRIIARIYSDSAYRNLGLQRGYNYVWRNSWNDADTATWVTKIIPQENAGEHVLTRDSRHLQYARDMPAKVPRLVILRVNSEALTICLDDPGCPTGHCGYF